MTILKISKFQAISETLIYYLKGLYHRASEHNIFLFAGGLSFSLFTCILPLILILFSFIGIVLELHGVKEQVSSFISTLVPYRESAEFIDNIVFSRMDEFRIFKTLSGSLGIIGLFFAASGLFSSIRTILNIVYKVSESKRFYIDKLRDIGMVLLVVAFFLVSMAILPALDFIPPLVQKLKIEQFNFLNTFFSTFISFSISLLSFLIIFFMFFLLYYLLPYGRIPVRVVLLGAFWASFFWLVAKELFGYYIAHAAMLSKIYGTYVFMVIVAFWIYYSSLILIIGAEIGQLFKEKQEDLIE